MYMYYANGANSGLKRSENSVPRREWSTCKCMWLLCVPGRIVDTFLGLHTEQWNGVAHRRTVSQIKSRTAAGQRWLQLQTQKQGSDDNIMPNLF